MKKMIALIPFSIILLIFIGGCLSLPIERPTINVSYFSGQERQNFDKGIFTGDFNKIFYACVDVIEADGYHVSSQSKDDGIIQGGPKTYLNDIYYLKCEVREAVKGAYKLKWSLLKITPGGGWTTANASEITSDDPKRRDDLNLQYNYQIFLNLKNIENKNLQE